MVVRGVTARLACDKLLPPGKRAVSVTFAAA